MKSKIAKKIACLGISLSLIASTFSTVFADSLYKVEDFPNLIDLEANLTNQPYSYYQVSDFSTFMDKGAWHGYSLPMLEDKDNLGAFSGPTILFKHKSESIAINLSDAISKLSIIKDGKPLDLEFANPNLTYYPGKIVQTFEKDGLKIDLELIFATDRTALIKTSFENLSENDIKLDISWNGKIFNNYINNKKSYDISPRIENNNSGINVIFDGKNEGLAEETKNNKFSINFFDKVKTNISSDKLSYKTSLEEVKTLKPKQKIDLFRTESFVFNTEEYQKEMKNITELNFSNVFKENEKRWQGYLDKTFVKENIKNSKAYDNVAVKSMMTMTTNWKSPAGDIKTQGITPSASYRWFNGFWAWDSWKNAMGVLKFEPELAKDAVRSMFDYQVENGDKDAGAIIDVIYYSKDDFNTRNSKPPLSAWTVYNIYEQTKDIEFIKEMYPKLVAYHNWWYTNRDTDKNGVAEFGGMVHPAHYKYDKDGNILKDNNNKPIINEEEIILAAAWESGMDNAIRFDEKGKGKDDIGIKIFENENSKGEIVGYSINQESVDLNSYLYAEKYFLKSLAEILGNKEDAIRFEKEAKELGNYIEKYMFDEETGFYYDLQISKDGKNKKLLVNRGKGTEGYMPLWANLASKEHADKVVANILDPNKFNLKMPFPTASKDSPDFNPNKYWRGPVWLDQALFGVEALENYGYDKEAIKLTNKLIDNAEGLLGSGTIRENYNPINGKGLHAKNFSWSAAAYYLLVTNTLQGNQNTCYKSK